MVFSIVNDFTKTNLRYKTTQNCVEFKLNNLNRFVENPELELKRGFRAIYEHIIAKLNHNDKVGLTFTAEDFDNDFHIPFKPVAKLTFENLWNLLQKLYQSKKEAIEGDTFKIITTSFTPFRGAGRVREPFITFNEECKKRRGIVAIKNKDNLCLARALVVAMAYVMNVPYVKQIRLNIGKKQDEEAKQLMQKVGVAIPPEGAGIEELEKFQQHLKDFKITVYEYGSKGRTVLFEGSNGKHKLNLLHYKNHYNVITSLTAAFACSYFCDLCHMPFDHKDTHRCMGRCPCCQHDPPCKKLPKEIQCEDCNRNFRGSKCFDQHKSSSSVVNGKSMCERVKRCNECLKTVKANRSHICGEIFCSICKQHQPQGHLCYIQADTRKPNLKDTLFVFYDLETRQDETDMHGNNVHTPVLCVFQQRCDQCINLGDEVIECNKCGLRRVIINGNDIIETFMNHLFQISKKFKSVTAIAHYGQAFDHIFCFNYIMTRTSLKPDVIMRGSKLLMMSVGKVKFLDTINYFPMKLSSLPKAFGLTELKKGYFPHLFNTVANKNYVGPMPDSKFYNPDSMKIAERAKFFEWYNLNKNKIFDLHRELIEYCISDVDILTKASLSFHKMFLETCNISPFTEAVTIPGCCNKLFRRNFLRPNTIGIIPRNGYRLVNNQSKIALQWLIYEEEKRGINIVHAGKQHEAVVGGVKVDGYCEENRELFEFNGCYYHGCIECFGNADRDAPIFEDRADTLNARYERTLKKTERLISLGYTVTSMWQHEFQQILDKDKNLKQRLDNHPMLVNIPLNPREAFYGGRTGCTKSYYKVKPGEKIKYIDVCSLYPYICKYGKFPLGHPKVYVGEECKSLNLQRTDGLIKCKILPPQDLYHPVLPLKMNNKLMFTLCYTCTKEKNTSEECEHTEEERCLVNTWVLDEVKKALEKGYKMLEIYEIWQYDVEQYDAKNKQQALFSNLIDFFIKTKQEASGWPSKCTTDLEKQAYIKEYFEREGVQLEYANIKENAGLRSLAKLILNSFWGKFGQRENLTKTSVINQPQELYTLDRNPSVEIKHITFINEDVLLANWAHKDEAVEVLPSVNVAIAAYVTAQARLKLYSFLERLGDRVLYYDTDSVIYISREGEEDIEVGSGLGDMTDELESYGSGSYIQEYISAGPKNYAFIVFCPVTGEYQQVCKIKGFCLNFKTYEKLNFKVMKEIILNNDSEPLPITSSFIRCTQRREIVTKEETKNYQPCLSKRKFSEFDSVPFGFKKHKLS